MATVRSLGSDWKPLLIHNLGWYASAVSRCGRLKVHVDTFPSKRTAYTAFLGKPGPGGRWSEGGRTPGAAARKVIRAAKMDLAAIGALFKDLPVISGH